MGISLACMSVPCECPGTEEDTRFFRTGVTNGCEPPKWVLGSEPGSCRRATSVLNH